MWSTASAGLLAGWAIALPVGAIGTYLIALAAQTSFAVGAAAALGVATVDGGYAALAVFGGRSLVPLLRPIITPLRIASAIVLAALAVRIVATAVGQYRRRDSPRPVVGTRISTGRVYLRLIALTAANPATVIYFAALVIGSRRADGLSAVGGLVFAAAAFVASASWQLTLAGGGAALGHLINGPRSRLGTAVISGAVIATFAVFLAASAG